MVAWVSCFGGEVVGIFCFYIYKYNFPSYLGVAKWISSDGWAFHCVRVPGMYICHCSQ